jgi:predicted deacylase
MRALDMLPAKQRTKTKREPLIIRSSTWIRAPRSGLLRSMGPLGGQVKKGDVLGVIADPFGENEAAVTASTDGIIIGKSNLPLAHEGDALFHVARHEGKQVVARSLDDFDPGTDYESGLTSELAAESPIV